MQLIKQTYVLAALVGAFCFFSSIGCFLVARAGANVGAMTPGDINALGCLEAGIALTCFLWWRTTRSGGVSGSTYLVAVAYAGTAGLALDTCLGYLFWGLGVPFHVKAMDIGTMAPNWWLGPFMLAYAVGCKIWLHRHAASSAPRTDLA